MSVTNPVTTMKYQVDGNFVLFNQSSMPRMFFVLLSQLEVYVHLLKDHKYPYMVELSESEFLSCIDMAKEL